MTALNEHDQDDINTELEEGTGTGAGTEDDTEARARRMGWVPEAEWDDERAEKEGRRKPKTFVSAQEFIENAENSVPILRAQLRALDAKLTEATKQNTEIYEVLQLQRKHHLEALERARAEEREKIEQERRQALREGDEAAFDAAEAKLKKLDAPEGEDTGAKPANGAQPPPQQDPPEIVEFRKANPWFTTDVRLTNNMIDEFNDVKREHPDWSFREQIAEARRKLADRFPEKFLINKRRENGRGGPMPPSGGSPENTVDRRFAALTAEEKGYYDRARKLAESRGGKLSKAEWLSEIGR